MKPETEFSVSKAKTEKNTAGGVMRGSVTKKKAAKRQAKSRLRQTNTSSKKSISFSIPEKKSVTSAATNIPFNHVSDLEFLDTVKETVYRKLLDNELDLKIDSGFKAIELKNKISETSENERLLLEILSEIRSEELSKS
jgi:hypothetical protein